LRSVVAPALSSRVGDGQQGAISIGGTLASSNGGRLVSGACPSCQVAGAVWFADLKAAFYTAMQELTLGRLLLDADRAASLALFGFNADEVQRFAAGHVEGLPLFQQCGVDAPWCHAVSDWHQRCWLSVEGGSRRAFTRGGVRLGDPLADVAFCLAFSCLLCQLRSEMEAAGLKVSLPHLPGGIFAIGVPSAAVARDEFELLPPSHRDDTALFLIGDSPAGLLIHMGEAAVLLRRVARSLGFEVIFADGKTEAFFAVHGPRSGAAEVLLA
jgi:hypothetical protein